MKIFSNITKYFSKSSPFDFVLAELEKGCVDVIFRRNRKAWKSAGLGVGSYCREAGHPTFFPFLKEARPAICLYLSKK